MQEKFGHLMCTREGFPGQVLLYLFDHSLRIIIIVFYYYYRTSACGSKSV